MKINRLFILFFLLQISCKNQEKKIVSLSISNDKHEKIQSFDSILNCGYFSDNGNYFVTADNGCVYNEQKSNGFGNLIIYLISNNNLKLSEEDVNKLNIYNLKEKFDIYLYLIPKKDLRNTPEGFYQKDKYKELLYNFDKKTKKWLILDSIEIVNVEENIKEKKWREDFIVNTASKSNQIVAKSDKLESIPIKWQGTYQHEFSEKFTDGTSTFWIYYFIVKNNKIIFKTDTEMPIGEEEYLGIEKNNQLELFEKDSVDPKYILKEESGKYFIKGDSFENNDVWVIFEKK